jgi:hypothetical protein
MEFSGASPLPFQLAFPINPYIIIRYTDTAATAGPILGLR